MFPKYPGPRNPCLGDNDCLSKCPGHRASMSKYSGRSKCPRPNFWLIQTSGAQCLVVQIPRVKFLPGPTFFLVQYTTGGFFVTYIFITYIFVTYILVTSKREFSSPTFSSPTFSSPTFSSPTFSSPLHFLSPTFL